MKTTGARPVSPLRSSWQLAIIALALALALAGFRLEPPSGAHAVIQRIYTLPFHDDYERICDYGCYSGHEGTDYQVGASGPGERVAAAASGTAWLYQQFPPNCAVPYCAGYYISMDHGNGHRTRYLHLQSYTVAGGRYVTRGGLIGYEGNTGTIVYHLHFETRHNGTPGDNCGSGTAVNPYASSTFMWATDPPGYAIARRVDGDYNGNGKAEIAVWRPFSDGVYQDGTWFIRGQSPVKWGLYDDIPAPGDYDGNGITEKAVWRPSDGDWYIHPISDGLHWGVSEDIPVPRDYNGDGATDRAVWRPSNGTWYVYGNDPVQWGLSTDVPVPADYNGDGQADLAVWRPSDGKWYVSPNRTGVEWGISEDIPVPGDYNGDARADLAVWRPSNSRWYIWQDSVGVPYGIPTNVPVSGDYNGTAATDIGVWRARYPGYDDSMWFIQGQSAVQWGVPDDVTLVGPFRR